MKKLFLLINSVSLLLLGFAESAVVSVTNNNGDSTIGITELDGLPSTATVVRGFNTTEAFMSFGYFSIPDASITNATNPVTLYSSLITLGTNERNFTAGTVGANGFAASAMQSAVTIAGTQFEGKNIYVFVANVANSSALTSASQVFVMKLNQTFLASWDSVANNTVTFGAADGTILLGGYNNYSFKTRNADTTTGPAFNTTTLVIPETSTSLLAVLGVFGLLRRRR